MTEVVAEARLPRSSTTLQVMVMAPGVRSAVARVAVGPLPVISPLVAEGVAEGAVLRAAACRR